MRSALAVIAVAATALAAAPEAKADDVQAFIEILRERGISARSGDGSLVAAGQFVCTGIGEGYTPMDMAQFVYENTDNSITMEDAGFIVGAAVGGLCPEYSYLIEGI